VRVLDCDGVIRHWRDEPVAAIEHQHGLPRGSVLAAAHHVPEYELGIIGRVSFGDWCRATADALAAMHGPAGYAAVRQRRQYRGDVDRDVVAAVTSARCRDAGRAAVQRSRLPAG
jgi:putative hydrolase of the HAD superfamily